MRCSCGKVLFFPVVLSFVLFSCTGMIDVDTMDGNEGSGDGFVDGGLSTDMTDSGTEHMESGDGMDDIGPDPCQAVDCGVHGECVVSGVTAQCKCDVGYHPEGLSCVEDVVDPCQNVTCDSHGTCVASGEQAYCDCDDGYHADGLSCVEDSSACDGVTCSGHGVCQLDQSSNPHCICDDGYEADGLYCISGTDPCGGQDCSGHGTCLVWDNAPVCACDGGFTPPDRTGLSCLPTTDVCVGGAIDYDVDGDGTNETWFEPNDWECLQYELVNRTRATHDPEGSPECHTPLSWSVTWSAHGRNHSTKMKDSGGLFHEDFPWGQNVAYGCDPECEMNMYMTGSSETHCPDLSHHCNIMRCSFSSIGIGYDGNWNTQNFF